MGSVEVAQGALTRAIYYLDRSLAASPKIRAFSTAKTVVADLGDDALSELINAGKLETLDGVGPSTASVITAAVLDEEQAYLDRLAESSTIPLDEGAALRSALRGDCHAHTLWSDGGAPVRAMAETAIALGHEWIVVTDHSPRLTIAHGLNPDRLRSQIEEIEAMNAELAPFRILTGMEVDILVDGSLDLPEELLEQLDVVVASVHSKLSMDRNEMTRRMVAAVASPHVDILGHCTGRKLSGRGRAPSQFDADIVFTACAQFGTAVEINCRPERQDPPDDLLDVALGWGTMLAIDTDAHAPGQLEWQNYGCDKAARHGIEPDQVINTFDADALLAWCSPS